MNKRICCIGHITRDKIITPDATTYLNGGTSYYFAHGISHLKNPNFQLVTAAFSGAAARVESCRSRYSMSRSTSSKVASLPRRCSSRKRRPDSSRAWGLFSRNQRLRQTRSR